MSIARFILTGFVGLSDNVDVGDVDKVGNEFIVVRDGVANIQLYYVPKPYITNYDGSSLWIDVPSGRVNQVRTSIGTKARRNRYVDELSAGLRSSIL